MASASLPTRTTSTSCLSRRSLAAFCAERKSLRGGGHHGRGLTGGFRGSLAAAASAAARFKQARTRADARGVESARALRTTLPHVRKACSRVLHTPHRSHALCRRLPGFRRLELPAEGLRSGLLSEAASGTRVSSAAARSWACTRTAASSTSTMVWRVSASCPRAQRGGPSLLLRKHGGGRGVCEGAGLEPLACLALPSHARAVALNCASAPSVRDSSAASVVYADPQLLDVASEDTTDASVHAHSSAVIACTMAA